MRKPRLLLVEDNPILQAQLIATLGSMYEVVAVAATAADAGAWLRSHGDGWDLAVVDIFLKEGHGYDVLRSCARRRAGQAVAVLSNYTIEPARSSAVRQGATAVFDKSFEMDAFLAWCASYALEDEFGLAVAR